MLKHLGVVQACCHSRWFRNNAMRKLGGRSLFEWVIRRVTDSIRLEGVVVFASGFEDRAVLNRMVPSDVPIFQGEGNDTLARFCKALEQYPSEAVVRVRGDTLFVDPGMIDRLVHSAESHPHCDYVGYCSRDGRPAILSPVGVYAEWFRASSLRKANRLATDAADREVVTRYIYSHPETFDLVRVPAPSEIDREDMRLTVDIEEDWDHILMMFEALGADFWDWKRVARMLDHQPAMRHRMAVLNREYANV
jgi:spore coat polysaccharide biosynthesis protein SpsF